MGSKLQVVVGGQYGSEGKGAVSAFLCRPEHFGNGVAVRVAGPNAGHTALDPSGRAWPLRQIPVAAVVNPDAELVIAAGSEIDPEVLTTEIQALEAGGVKVRDRLYIDAQATILEPGHRATETAVELVDRIGSTGKGIGAARADRIMRNARIAEDWPGLEEFGVIGDTARHLQAAMRDGQQVLIEGTQGYGLGLHTWHYPQTTSSDCRAVDFLAMAGVSPWGPEVNEFEVFVCARPYPIRVAGNSGWMLQETTWAQLGLPEERTTVTQKIRRVGMWDNSLVREAICANGGPGGHVRLALTMMDQVYPEIRHGIFPAVMTGSEINAHIHAIQLDLRTPVALVGTGPGTMIDLRKVEEQVGSL